MNSPFQIRVLKGERQVKPSTVLNYVRQLKRVIVQTYPEWSIDEPYLEKLCAIVKDNKIKQFLTSVTTTTGNTILTAVIVGLSPDRRYKWVDGMGAYGELLNLLLKKRQKIYYEKLAKQILTPQQELNWTDWETLMAIHKKYKRKITWYKNAHKIWGDSVSTCNQAELLQMYLVSSLYLLIPPRRLEYADMALIHQDDYDKLTPLLQKKNYLVWNGNPRGYGKTFHFGDYKTFKHYGIQTFKIKSRLNTVINMWLRARSADSSKYLLTTHTGKKMSKNYLTKFIQKTFRESGKEISVTMLRHIFLSNVFKNETSLEEKKLLATRMGHSVSVQQNVYVKKHYKEKITIHY